MRRRVHFLREFIKCGGYMPGPSGLPVCDFPASKAISPRRQPPICPSQEWSDSRNLRHHPERPGPPNRTRNPNQRIGPAVNPSLRRQQSHLGKRFVPRQPKARRGPRGLERDRMEAAPNQAVMPAIRPTPAQGALGVVEQPAFDIFCNFCIHRNIIAKKFISSRDPAFSGPCRPS